MIIKKQINARRFPRVKIVDTSPSPIICVDQLADPIVTNWEVYDKIPMLLNPNARINKPIPIDIPNLNELGIE